MEHPTDRDIQQNKKNHHPAHPYEKKEERCSAPPFTNAHKFDDIYDYPAEIIPSSYTICVLKKFLDS